MKTFVFSLAMLVTSVGFSKNHVVYFGGGLSSIPGDKAFDSTLKNAIEISKKSDWDGDFYYRQNLPANLKEADAKNVKLFSEQNFNQKLVDMLNETKPGEQLLVVLATHGDKKDRNLVVGSDTGQFDIKSLENFIKQAEAKGIKLAIVGGTNFSGSLMKNKSDKTCIIANAPPDKVGAVGDTIELMKWLGASGSKNLEEAYLQTRERLDEKAIGTMPMISTAAGAATDEMMYPLKPSVTRKEDLPYFLTRPLCTRTELAMETLQESINDNSAIGSAIYGDKVKLDYDALKAKTMAYDEEFAETKDVVLLAAKQVCTTVKGQQVCMRMGNLEKLLLKKDELAKSSPESLAVVEELVKSEDYKAYAAISKKWQPKLDSLGQKALEISESERVLYNRVYKKLSEDPKFKNAPNPCRDFKI